MRFYLWVWWSWSVADGGSYWNFLTWCRYLQRWEFSQICGTFSKFIFFFPFHLFKWWQTLAAVQLLQWCSCHSYYILDMFLIAVLYTLLFSFQGPLIIQILKAVTINLINYIFNYLRCCGGGVSLSALAVVR